MALHELDELHDAADAVTPAACELSHVKKPVVRFEHMPSPGQNRRS
jgi:hypothetical protein